MRVLNVGGGASRTLPAQFDGWEQHLLDINPVVKPDICCDAREMVGHVDDAVYDAIYCSHNLEHFYRHDVPKVLAGFMHALKEGGYAHIAVPNLQNLMVEMQSRNLDVDDVWYRAGSNPITFHDVLYGWSMAMRAGNIFYAHKCGFTPLSLENTLLLAGFCEVNVLDQGANITAIARKAETLCR